MRLALARDAAVNTLALADVILNKEDASHPASDRVSRNSAR